MKVKVWCLSLRWSWDERVRVGFFSSWLNVLGWAPMVEREWLEDRGEEGRMERRKLERCTGARV